MSPLIRRARWYLDVQRMRFWRTLDSDAVRLYQSGMYTLTFLAAIYMLVCGIPVSLDMALEDHVQDVWLLLNLIGPPLVLIGVRHTRSKPDTGAWNGLVMQCAGNTSLALAYGGYIAGVLQENWGSGVYAPFLISGLSAWSLLLSVRDFRKLAGVERKLHR